MPNKNHPGAVKGRTQYTADREKLRRENPIYKYDQKPDRETGRGNSAPVCQ